MHLTCIGRVGASEKNEMYRRQMVKEKRQGIVDRLRRDDAVIVTHQREWSIQLAQIMNQGRQDGLDRQWLWGLQYGQSLSAEARLKSRQRSDEVSLNNQDIVCAGLITTSCAL